jgi:outer membrane protein TolC
VNRFISALIVALAVPALAADASLKTYLDAADKQNIDQRITLEQRERVEAEYTAAWAGLLPALGAQGTWTNNQYTASIGPVPPLFPVAVTLVPKDQLDGALQLTLPLIDTTRWLRLMAAGTNQEGARERELVTRDLIRKQVVGSYFGYAASLAVLTSSKKSVAVAESQLKLTEIRFNAGAVTELDVLRARAEVQRNRQTVADAASLVATTRRTLRTLSGVEPPADITLPAADLRPETAFEELEKHVDDLPAVHAAQKDREAAERVRTSSALALVPVVGAQFTERFTNATSFTGKVTSYNAGVSLSWRLDGPTIANMSVQEHVAATAALAIERAQLMARDQIHSDWQSFNAALLKVEAADAQVQAATKAQQVARDRYNAGAATQVDVIQADRDLFQAEVAQISARTSLVSARLSLHISAGQPVE